VARWCPGGGGRRNGSVLEGGLSKSDAPSGPAPFAEVTTFARTCLANFPSVRGWVRQNAVASHPGDRISPSSVPKFARSAVRRRTNARVLTNAATWRFLAAPWACLKGRRIFTYVATDPRRRTHPPDTFLRTWLRTRVADRGAPKGQARAWRSRDRQVPAWHLRPTPDTFLRTWLLLANDASIPVRRMPGR
jgi:hypothetical protein